MRKLLHFAEHFGLMVLTLKVCVVFFKIRLNQLMGIFIRAGGMHKPSVTAFETADFP